MKGNNRNNYFTAIAACFYLSKSLFCQTAVFPNPGTVYDRQLHSIRILMPQDSFNHMVAKENVWTNHLYKATFIYDETDTLFNIGIRIKGNTSRNAKRKSFRLEIDAFEKQNYQGLKIFNIHGNLNDPSMTREYLSAFAMNQGETHCLRVNPIKLFVNNQYFGIRANSEYIDKTFLYGRFKDNSGNLYKCTWPADLTWLGNDPAKYKALINNATLNERAYDLKTNELLDDYSDLVHLIDVINNSPKDSFSIRLERIFDVQFYLRTLALEVLNGHWDNYYANKNNYFLYHNPSTGKFIYLPYDMDNTFGVQWGFSNINKRDIFNWGSQFSAAPLTKNILNNTNYRRDYEFYIKNFLSDAWNKDSLYKELDYIAQLIGDGMSNDPFFIGAMDSDYGFNYNNWQESYTIAWGNHVSFGIKPYIFDRTESLSTQFKFNGNQELPPANFGLIANPSKCSDLQLRFPKSNTSSSEFSMRIYNSTGRVIFSKKSTPTDGACRITELASSPIAPGIYTIYIDGYLPLQWVVVPD